jgi:2-hydroxy-3-keto-5-methylthiopentenyl-1-phosphate phosphatase
VSDVVFAKDKLIDLLKEAKKEFIQFEDFSELWGKVKTYL